MRQCDANHPESESLQGRIQQVKEEFSELCEEPSLGEFFDVLHTIGRLLESFTGIWFFCLIAWPTVKKHAQRTERYGCTRSRRNCCGKCVGMSCISH